MSDRSPRASRLATPRWLDARLVLGVVLVLVAVVVGARVFASAGRYTNVYVARHALVPGEHLDAADLSVGQVRFSGEGGSYVAVARCAPTGYLVTRYVAAGEFVPLTALSAAASTPARAATSRCRSCPATFPPISSMVTSSMSTSPRRSPLVTGCRCRPACCPRLRWTPTTAGRSRCPRGRPWRSCSTCRPREVGDDGPRGRERHDRPGPGAGCGGRAPAGSGRCSDRPPRLVSVSGLTAVGDPRWEADLSSGLSRDDARRRGGPALCRPRRPARGRGRGSGPRGHPVRRSSAPRSGGAEPACAGPGRGRRAGRSRRTRARSDGCVSSASRTCCRTTPRARRCPARCSPRWRRSPGRVPG